MPKKRLQSSMERQEVLSEERTVLSRERTILSFMQTGLAFMGVGLVLINVFKDSIGIVSLGALLTAIGIAEVIESLRRMQREKKIMKNIKSKEKKFGVFR